jgi:isovaleryl-CoA dehydrogenase
MNDMPGLDFGLGEMADTIRETTERFAREQIAPIAAGIDEKDEFPRHLWPQMGELGLHGITVEEELAPTPTSVSTRSAAGPMRIRRRNISPS